MDQGPRLQPVKLGRTKLIHTPMIASLKEKVPDLQMTVHKQYFIFFLQQCIYIDLQGY